MQKQIEAISLPISDLDNRTPRDVFDIMVDRTEKVLSNFTWRWIYAVYGVDDNGNKVLRGHARTKTDADTLCYATGTPRSEIITVKAVTLGDGEYLIARPVTLSDSELIISQTRDRLLAGLTDFEANVLGWNRDGTRIGGDA